MDSVKPSIEGPLEVFWLSGCSACLRMKEFVEATGMPFVSINAQEQPAEAAKLLKLGFRAPAVCRGERCVNGTELADVADLLGVSYSPPNHLSPADLRSRYRLVTDALIRYVDQLPPSGYKLKLPGRDREALRLAGHAATAMRYFLELYYAEDEGAALHSIPSLTMFDEALLPNVGTAADVSREITQTQARFEEWWARDGFDEVYERVIPTYWGHRTLHEALEREVWHTAQHVRQVMHVLELLGVAPDNPVTDDDLVGLPLPARIYQ
jgi:hypothetical protein